MSNEERKDRRAADGDAARDDENPYTPEEIAKAQELNSLAWGGIGVLPVGETTVVSLEELARKRRQEEENEVAKEDEDSDSEPAAENPQPYGDAELGAMTVIVDGQPMTLQQAAEYRKAKKEQEELGSAELQGTVFIIDGIPMSSDQVLEYRARKAAAQAALEEEDDEEDPVPDLTNPMAKELYYFHQLATGKITREEYDAIIRR